MSAAGRTLRHAGRDWEVVVDGLGRLEAPCFDGTGRLLFSDVADEGAVHRLDVDGTVDTVVKGRAHVGGIVPLEGGGFVATGHTVDAYSADGDLIATLMEPDGGYGFNDLTTDAQGNIYVGMHGERPSAQPPVVEASLWRIAPGGAIDRCYGGVQLTNGVRVSADGKQLFHNDTVRRVVWVSDLAPGELPTGRRVFHEVDGLPDGMAVDLEGGVWVAAVGSGKVFRIGPDGRTDLVLETPMTHVSACCFGGDDRRDLYVTTFGAPYDTAHTGSVIRTRTDHVGLPAAPARR